MKKLLLILALSAGSAHMYAQVQAAGVSPASIAGTYVFEWNDGTDWLAAPDLTVPGTFVQDTLMLISDGTAGTNAQGNPVSAEACAGAITTPPSPPGPGTWNDVSGKIAVVYRNTCNFGYKAFRAEQEGAVGVIIINRDNEVVEMGAGTDGGPQVTIPVIMLSSVDGAALVSEMANGPVVFFIGSKFGLVPNDMGALQDNILIPRKGTNAKFMADANPDMELGIELYNYGSSNNMVQVNAVISGPSGVVYNDTVGPVMVNSFDTLYILGGEAVEFPVYSPSSWATGDYTVTYTISIPDSVDMDPADNVFSSNFSISAPNANSGIVSNAASTANVLDVPAKPSNATTSYKACQFIANAAYPSPNTGVEGFYFAPGIDTTGGTLSLVGEDVFLEVWEWNDVWADGLPAQTEYAVQTQVGFGTFTASSDDIIDETIYQALDAPVTLVPGQRYLMCVQTYNPEVYFAADKINYSLNSRYYVEPAGAVNVDDTWYSGWSGGQEVSLGLKLSSNLSIEENAVVLGSAYPNPSSNMVTVSVAAQGKANLTITDISGKTAYTGALDLNSGKADVNISNLESGMYVFNVKLENGQTSQFNVVKN